MYNQAGEPQIPYGLAAEWEKNALGRVLSCVGFGVMVFLLSSKLLLWGIQALLLGLTQVGVTLPFPAFQLANLVLYTINMTLPMLVLVRLLGRPFRYFVPLSAPPPGLVLPALGVTLGLCMGANFTSSFLVMAIQEALGRPVPSYVPQFGQGALSILLTFLFTAIAPAIMEELLFRGVILHSLRPFGDGFAIFLSAAVFALCHTTIGQLLPAFAAGLCLATFVVRSGSVRTGIIIHFSYNLLVTLVSMGGHFGGPEWQTGLTLALMAVSLVAAAISRLILRGRYGAIFAIAPQPTLLSRGQRAGAVLTNVPLLLAVGLLLGTTLSGMFRGAQL